MVARFWHFLAFISALQLSPHGAPSQVGAVDSAPFYYIILPKVLILDNDHDVTVYLTPATSARLSIKALHITTKVSKLAGVGVISKGSGTVKMRFPFDAYTANSVQLFFVLQQCATVSDSDCLTKPTGKIIVNSTIKMPILRNSLFLFAEFDKPVYKPKDMIRFRVLPLYSGNLRPYRSRSDQLVYDLIYLESPKRLRMAQWANASWITGLEGFSYPLSADPELGIWKVVAQIGSQRDEEKVEVKKYVLPQFTVDLKPPLYLVATDKKVNFAVCAKYSTNLPMRGRIWAKLYLQGYGKQRPAIVKSAVLDGKADCVYFQESTAILNLRNSSYYSRQIVLNATVTEEGTSAKVSKSQPGGYLTFSYFQLAIDSGDVYYRGLPYYGQVRSTNPDGSPYPGARVHIRLGYWTVRFGYFKEYTSDSNGIIRFAIPPIPGKLDTVSLSVSGAFPESIPYERGRMSMWAPYTSKVLRAAYSPSNTFLRITPLYKMPPQDPCSSGVLKLRLSANVRLFTRNIHVVVTAGGEIKQRIILNPEINAAAKECEDTDNDVEGHYKCVTVSGTDRGLNITCLKGWTGDNCLTPLCTQRCMEGVCGAPNKCICKEGWLGPSCTFCLRRLGCEHGYCYNGNDCQCYPGWSGRYCNRRRYYHYRRYYYTYFAKKRIACGKNCLETDPRYSVYDPNKFEIANIFRREIEVPWSNSMAPSAQVVVYFEYQNMEIVSDSVELPNLSLCLRQAVPTEFKFSSAEVRPGTKLTGNIKTTGDNAKCALSIVDIAMRVFGSAGGVSYEEVVKNFQDLIKRINQYHQHDYYQSLSSKLCEEERKSELKRTKRTVIPRENFSNRRDSSRAFIDAGIVILSNIEVITKPCDNSFYPPILEDMEVMAMEASVERAKTSDTAGKTETKTDEKETLKEVVRPKVRTFFPESWKFLYVENPSPTSPLNLVAPDSMTTWLANMYCVSSQGLGISPPASLKVFQPFFIQMVLPYSLIRGEVANIPVKVFNYINDCYEINVKMKESADFAIIGHQFEEFCICGFERKTAYFRLNATSVKSSTVEVLATPITSSRGLCKQGSHFKSSTALPADGARRKLLLEAEGIPQELNIGDVICAPAAKKSLKFNLNDIQKDIVPDSGRAYLSWSGDILGPALDNLDRLVKMPYGCGEQNMATVVPSISVLIYFTKSGIDNQAIKLKAKGYIERGFIRQQRYRHPDGSYSAFGGSSRPGSTWLTAFVLKSFSQAQKYVPTIDDNVLAKATSFLLSKQRKTTGCICEDGNVYSQYLKGGMKASDADKATMTAFVLSSLLEAKDNTVVGKLLGGSIQEAVTCLSKATPSSLDSMSTYALALRTYALVRWNSQSSLTQKYLTEFRRRVATVDGLKYVPENRGQRKKPGYYRPWIYYSAADVEITAYFVRCLYYSSEKPSLIEMLPYLRWLTVQRNSRGGWYSTQDTVIALAALSEAASLMNGGSGGSMNLDLVIRRSDVSTPITAQLRPNNKLIFNRQSIDPKASVEVDASGSGCAVVQMSLLFNSRNFEKHASVSPFAASGTVKPTTSSCDRGRMRACMRYNPSTSGSTTTMVIMKAKMASGWMTKPDSRSTLQATMKSGGLRMVEEEADKSLVLYYDPIADSDVCSDFEIERFLEVEDLDPMILQVYDYYQPEQVVEVNVPVYTGICEGAMKSSSREHTVGNADTCPICVEDEAGVLDALETNCTSSNYSVVWGKRTSTTVNEWTFRYLSKQEMVLGWSSTMILPSRCTCNLKTETVMISLQKRSVNTGKPILVDGSWLIINPAHIKSTYKKLSSQCKKEWKKYPFSVYLSE